MHTAWHLVGLLSGTLFCLTAQADGEGAARRPPTPTLEALKTAAAEEFDAAAQSLRERFARADEHDEVGEALAARAVQEHRARYLALKRALEQRSPPLASAADSRSPFVPDFHTSPAEAPSFKPIPRSGNWDLYAHASLRNRSDAPPAGEPMEASLTRRWGMYGQPERQVTAPAAMPVLVTRAPERTRISPEDFLGVTSVGIHTTEERQ